MLYTTYQSEPHPPASSSSRAGESQAGGLPPIERMAWPKGEPLPTYSEIARTTAMVCGADIGDIFGPRSGSIRASTPVAIARQIIFILARDLLGMSAKEVAESMRVARHQTFTTRRHLGTCQFADSPAGTSVVNEVIYSMRHVRRNSAQASRKMLPENNILVGDGDYKAAARAALAGHAGRATEEN